MTLYDLAHATPGELREAVSIFDNIEKLMGRLQQLHIGQTYENEVRDLYKLYQKTQGYPAMIRKVYSFQGNQSEIYFFDSSDYKEYLRKDYVWCCVVYGKEYSVDMKEMYRIFEMLKFAYLDHTISIFHPSYGIVKPKHGDVPGHFESFIKRTEEVAKAKKKREFN